MTGGNSALISKGLRRIDGGRVAPVQPRQFSPDFKGIETSGAMPASIRLTRQFSPDFKGIETLIRDQLGGLRQRQFSPDFKGIETTINWKLSTADGRQFSPDFKGIETFPAILACVCPSGGNSALISKGLRPRLLARRIRKNSRQFSPDFKGIET